MLQTVVIYLFAMVGEIHHDGIAVRKHAYDAVYYKVVVACSVQIVGNYTALLLAERKLTLYVACFKLGKLSRIALAISGMLSV